MPDLSTISSLSELVPIEQIVFWIMTAFTLGGAIGVVSSRRLFHSALYLILSFFGVTGYYVLLSAGFLAVVQLMIYVGAIAILIVFAIMFSRQAAMESPDIQTKGEANRQWWISLPIVFTFFILLYVIVGSVNWPVSEAEPVADMVTALGQAFLGSYLIPFEVVGILLSVALIGGVILARERTKSEETQ